MLPSTNFKMTLESEPQDGYFQKCFEDVLKKFSAHGKNDDFYPEKFNGESIF